MNTNSNSEDTITFKRAHFYSVLVVLAFAVGILTGYVVWGGSPTQAQAGIDNQPAAQAPTAASQQELMETIVAQTRHFRGDPNAPVTMIEFGDFQCPFCGRFFAQTEPQIDEAYIQSGKVRFGYFNFAFLGQESNWAAEAAECASDQNKFWEYHDTLYSSQSGENQGAFNKDNLKKFAENLGLEMSAFNKCLDSGKYAQLVLDDSNTSSSIGVRSTPTFFINSLTLVGAQPLSAFTQLIDKELAGEIPK